MSILSSRALRLLGALCAATLTFACTTPASFTPVATSEHPTLSALPPIGPTQGRIVLYRKAKAEGPNHALTMIDADSTFDIRPGRFSHRDVAPGEHRVEVVLAERDYTKLIAGPIGRRLEKRVLNHRLYGKPLHVEIRAGETTYVEVATAGVGVSENAGLGGATGYSTESGSRFGSHFVTLTPSYHSAAQVPGLRYRVLFPTLLGADAGSAQSALRLATRCGPECSVSPKIAELATRSRRSSPIASSPPATSPTPPNASDGSTPAREAAGEELVNAATDSSS